MEKKAVQEIALEEMRSVFTTMPTGRKQSKPEPQPHPYEQIQNLIGITRSQAQSVSFLPLYGSGSITRRTVSNIPNFDTVPKTGIDYVALEVRIINRLLDQGDEAPAPSKNRVEAKNQVWRWLYIDPKTANKLGE